MNKLIRSPRLLLFAGLGALSLTIGLLFLGTDRQVEANQAQPSQPDVLAQTVPTDGAPTSFFSESLAAGSIVRTLLALLAVIACIYLGVWLLKRFSGGTIGAAGQRVSIDVLQTRHFGPKRAISLIRVADRAVLIGMTDQQMTTLTELTAEETSQLMQGNAQEERSPTFAGLMSRAKEQVTRVTTGGSVTAV